MVNGMDTAEAGRECSRLSIVYMTPDAAFAQVRHAPIALLMMARTTNHQPDPRTALPRVE